jgi:3-oxoacyl-[acyl-carrier protein] reductase
MLIPKKALVTGASQGIGRSIALHLASLGFDVAVHYNRSSDAAKAVTLEASAHGVKSIALQADITRPQEVQHLVDVAAEELGGLSVIVNNVGNYLKKPLEKVELGEWHDIMDTNLNATFYVTQISLPYLMTAGWGRIINLGFAGAKDLVARPLIAPYAIAKTGVILYTKSLAKQLIQYNITANIVSPGIAASSISQPLHEIPCKRSASLDEVVNAVNFFVDERSSYVTGQVLEVAGGWNL